MHPGLFLDRDGTINEELHFISSPDQLTLITGSAEAIRQANHFGFKVVVISNQSGVARGFMTEENVRTVNAVLVSMLFNEDASIDGVYYCPHHPEAEDIRYKKNCDCRKPNTGMLVQAAKEHDIDFRKSFVIGDRIADMKAGNDVGAASILVRTGYGAETIALLPDSDARVEYVAENLLDAVQFVTSKLHQDKLKVL
jgi:D-glycero-D-manno-heptose 1,7-bisphosphate phosphatase